MRNSRDKILDACLSEVVGGQRPPDLSDRILRSLKQEPSRRSNLPILLLALACCLMIAVIGVVYVQHLKRAGGQQPEIAAGQPGGSQQDEKAAPADSASTKTSSTTTDSNSSEPANPRIASSGQSGVSSSGSARPEIIDPRASDVSPPQRVVEAPRRAPTTRTRSSDAEIAQAISVSLRRRWQAASVAPAAAATDGEWCRRVFLDLIGRIPTHREISEFIADKSPDKREKLVDRLLSSDIHLEEFARHWSTIWTNLLIGRDDDARGGSVNREGFQQFVRRSFLHNKPYDQFVRDLLTATGSNRPGDDDFNGAVSFMLQNLGDKAVPATAKTARIFLGVQVQCTQCHNHPFNDAKQSQFWQLNAFFRQAQPKPSMVQQGPGSQGTRLVNSSFAGEAPNNAAGPAGSKEAEIFYEERNGQLKVAYPAFIDGTRIDPSGDINDVNRREELARLIVNSDTFAQAIVNRTWAHFLGYGFTRQVDDMGPHNPPSHPELLDRLSNEFVAHNFDLKKLYRWVVLSEPYSLSSKAPAKTVDDPEREATPLFSRFYLRQMRPEELFESLRVMIHGDALPAEDVAALERRKSQWMQQFTIAYQTDDVDETTTYNGSVALTLDMWNGELVNRAVSFEPGTLLQRVSNDAKIKDKIGYLYLAALGRQPTAQESHLLDQTWKARGGKAGGPQTTAQDLLWVLLNSNEFVMNR